MQRKPPIARREFLKQATTATGAAWLAPHVIPSSALGLDENTAPSNRINVAAIGVGMKGTDDLRSFMTTFGELQFTAVCDVDRQRVNVNGTTYGREPARQIVEDHYAKKASGAYQGCRVYVDYRELLDKEPDLDAVLVGTPDHTHAVVSIAAMKKGKHVFCQKPLTHSVFEARRMAETARETKTATQCGTGNYTSEGTYRLREWIADGAIGAVREVHNWSNRPVWPQGIARPQETPPVPPGLDWDLWLGPAPYRPYNPIYLPFVWRGWWDFGTGALGDMGCYSFDVIVRTLNLDHPAKVEACCSRFDQKVNRESYPRASIVYYDFPTRGDRPPVRLTWYDGGLKPPRLAELDEGQPMSNWSGGMLFVGETGKILCDFTGNNPRLIPESKMKAYRQPPKTLPRSAGHHEEWVAACQGGPPAGANFEVAGHVSEILLLGNIALRTGQILHIDGENLKITNSEEANRHIRREYRENWTL